jgi:hypothetical protein
LAASAAVIYLDGYHPCESDDRGLIEALAYFFVPIVAVVFSLPEFSWKAYWWNVLACSGAIGVVAALYGAAQSEPATCGDWLDWGWPLWLLWLTFFSLVTGVVGAGFFLLGRFMTRIVLRRH